MKFEDNTQTLFIYEYAREPAIFVPDGDAKEKIKKYYEDKKRHLVDSQVVLLIEKKNNNYFEFLKSKQEEFENKDFSFTIKVVPGDSKKEYIVLRPQGIIGAFIIKDDNKHLNIVVLPKIFEGLFDKETKKINDKQAEEKKKRMQDFLTMLNYAYSFDFDIEKNIPDMPDVKDFVNVFIYIFLRQTADFVRNKLKRYYVRRREYLNSRVRGKILVGEYVAHCLPQKRDNIIPCEFYEFSMNILENQIIKYATYLCRQYLNYSAWSSGSALRGNMAQMINQIEPYLWDAELKKITIGDFARVRKHGFFKRYTKILDLAKLIIQHINAALVNDGKMLPVKEFSIDTAVLFEKFLFGVVKEEFNVKYQKSKKYSFSKLNSYPGNKEENKISETEFDMYVTYNKQILIIDSKYYKDIFAEGGEINEVKIKSIKPANIYQIVSYCNIVRKEELADSIKGVLVYPYTGDNAEIFKCVDFELPIYILPIKLSGIDEKSVKKFNSDLHDILKNEALKQVSHD